MNASLECFLPVHSSVCCLSLATAAVKEQYYSKAFLKKMHSQATVSLHFCVCVCVCLSLRLSFSTTTGKIMYSSPRFRCCNLHVTHNLQTTSRGTATEGAREGAREAYGEKTESRRVKEESIDSHCLPFINTYPDMFSFRYKDQFR
jgi:hypothetical protein